MRARRDPTTLSLHAIAALVLLLLSSPAAKGAVTFEESMTGSGKDSPVTLPVIQGGTDQTYVLWVSTHKNLDVTAVSGGGLSWTVQKEQCATDSKRRIELWTAQGSPGSAFGVQITFEGGEQLSAVLARYSGVQGFEDPSSENPAGVDGSCSDKTKSETAQLTLTSTGDGSVHAIGIDSKDKTVSSFSAGYSLVASDVDEDDKVRTSVYHQSMGSATTDTFQATLSNDTEWATAGIVLTPIPTVDHFAISHGGSADPCSAENVTITRHAPPHAVDTTYTGTITLSTSTANGNWSLVSGAGTLVNSGNGAGTYTYAAADNGSVVLGLLNTITETLSINVTAGSATEDAHEDPSLAFGDSAVITLEESMTGWGEDSPVTLPVIQGGTDQTYVLWVSTHKNLDVTAVSGGGLSWTVQKEQCATDSKRRIELWTAQGSPGSAFGVQITHGGGEQLSAVLARYSGVQGFEDPSSENPAGVDGSCADKTKSETAQLTLTSTGDGSVHAIGIDSKDETVSSFSAGYSLVASDVDEDGKVRTSVYHQTMGTATTDTFQATLSNDTEWATAGIVLTPATVTSSCGADHFAITHDGLGINCQAEPITLVAHDSAHNPLIIGNPTPEAVTLTSSTSNGDWVSIISGNGVLANIGNGQATYTFTNESTVVLGLKDTFVETVNINISGGGAAEDVSEDPDLVFDRAGFNFLGDGVKNAIGLQIAGKPSDIAPGNQVLEIQAIKTNDDTGACEAALVGANTIDLALECENPAICSVRQVNIDGTDIAGNNAGASPLGYTGVSLDFGDATDSTATFVMSYPDAGRIQLHARYNIPLDSGAPSGNLMLGASNEYIVRPFAFHVTAAGNPAADNPAGPVFTSAGTDFTLTARATIWEAADDIDNDGIADGHNDTIPSNNADLSNNFAALNYGQESVTEQVFLGAQLHQPLAGTNPGLAGGTSITSFAGGSGSTSTARYDEVGIIEVNAAVADSDYLGIGAAATANIAGRTGFIGRFIPDRLQVTSNTPDFRDATNPWACTFTYLEQEFGYATDPVLTVVALNVGGTTTNNYGDVFWKLASGLGNRAYSDSAATGASLNWSTNGGVAILADHLDLDGDGTLTISGDGLTYTKPVAPEAPFNALVDLSLPAADLSDSDGVCYDSDDNGICDSFQVSGITGTELRFGRLVIQNAFGSELLELAMPMFSEYFLSTSTGFIVNSEDNCTSFAGADITLSNYQGNLNAGETSASISGTFVAGRSNLNLSKPAAGDGVYDGSVDLSIDLSAAGTNNPYLQFDWDGNGSHDNDPLGRATFGIYHGETRHIYLRELY